ncbi:Type II secretion envelope pseudopilin protein (PulG,guides folded protein to PulD in outer membrane) [hydrothermal vent metagenome]|uniref:Type II secretion envelope pseudopilin protein (PulG,guides folded protein to PulD in outer membrane) n=1 Tax=hydrothermal vent metagenome TaxID=652676 RepID=A0A1W1CXK8_9ZZZZ
MQKAFTIIELIFVILIIGILSATALPKLAATRDDAKISTIAHSTMVAAEEIAAYAAANGQTAATLTAMSNNAVSLVDNGYATQNGVELTIGSVDSQDCLRLKVENQGANTEILKIDFTGSGGNCDTLQSYIDQSAYPIPLRGARVIF